VQTWRLTHLANYPHFTEPQGSLRGHKSPPLAPILRQMSAVHTLLLHLFKSHSHNILPSTPVFSSGLYNKNHDSACISSHAFHVSHPTHANFNHSNIILARSTNHEALHNAIFFPSYLQVPSSAPCPQRSSSYVRLLLLTWKTMFHTHTKQQAQLQFCMF